MSSPGRQGEILPADAKKGILPEPYIKSMRVVGHTRIYDRPGNLQMAWVDDCAYVSSSVQGVPGGIDAEDPRSGLAVINVSDPENPRIVKLLRDRGAIQATETIHAVAAKDRKVLVAGAYAGGNPMFGPDDPAWLNIYDVSDCADPKLMAEYQWPENAHTVTLSADGRRVYGTNQEEFTGRGGIQVLDISDLRNPRFLGKLGVTDNTGKSWKFASHEISLSQDGRRIYAAVTDSTGGDMNPGLKDGFSLERMSPGVGGVYILDNSDIVDGKDNPTLRLLGTVLGGGWHSVMPARINGVPYLVGGDELFPCPGTFPKIINIANESKPFIEGEFRLEMNHPENCPDASGDGHMAALALPAATLHYNDVDNAENTRFGLFNFTAAGLRVADLSDPANPVEVAYFRPGDMCSGHVRYFPTTGQIWSVCSESGFWVTQISPELR